MHHESVERQSGRAEGSEDRILSASFQNDEPRRSSPEYRISDRTTTTESPPRTQHFREQTTTIAPAELLIDVTTVTTASERIVKSPLEKALLSLLILSEMESSIVEAS